MIKLNNLFIIISLLILIFCVFLSKDLRLDASSDTLILKNDETFKFYQSYNDIFPAKNFLVLAIKSNNKIDKEYIKNINLLKNKIEKFKNVSSIFSIVDAPILISNKSNLTKLANSKIENINNSDIDLNLILNEFSSSPILKDQIINNDQNISSMIIYLDLNKEFQKIKKELKDNIDQNLKTNLVKKNYLEEKIKDNNNKKKLIKEIRDLLKLQSKNYQYYLGGIDMISSDTIDFIKNDIKIFSLAVTLFIIIILFIIYQEAKWVIIPLFTTIYSVLLMIGLIVILKWEITAISSNFISLMLILSISMNIHIINNYKINYFNNNTKNTLSYTFAKMFWPCLYTALTTIVAFGSLLFSNIKPIIDFGSIMIVALIIIFITSFTILPLLINLFPKFNNKNLKLKFLKNLFKIALNKTKYILSINLIVFLLSVYGITKLNVENSFIDYFKSNTHIYKGMKLIDNELGGTTPLDIIITFDNDISSNDNIIKSVPDDDLIDDEIDLVDDFFDEIDIDNENISWFNKEKIMLTKKIHQYLESRDEIGKVQSIHSLIEMANIINQKPLSIFELSIIYNEIPNNYKQLLIDPFLSTDKNMIKISARVKDSDNINRNQLILDINNYLKNNFSDLNQYKVNGLLVLYNNMLQSLFNSQIKSFGIILTSIFLMFLILFRSFKLSIIGMIPNIIASSFILGLIGLLGIPLDIMTITIAAITIGIAVDNTIHYIYRYKQNRKIFTKTKETIHETNNSVGNAIMTTSLTIAFGFSVLCLSNFIPTIFFGLFTALAMLIAMVGVLVTLPSILNKFKI